MRIDNPVGSEAQLTGSFSGSFLGDGSNIFNIVSASNSLTASYVAFSNVANKPTLISSSAQIADEISGSFTSASASIATDLENLKSDSGSFSTRVTNLENFSSSLNSTFATDLELAAATASLSSSVALLSSSFEAFESSYNSGSFSGSFQGNGSRITGVVSASYSQTSSYSLGVDFGNIQNLPGGLISASAQLSNTTIPGNLTIGGTLTAEQFYTEYITSSVIYQSGSTKFGDTSDDTHQFTGSIRVLGSITGSLFGTAATASYVTFSNVANKPTLVSSSQQILDYGIFATTGSNNFVGNQTISGSLVLTGSVTSSRVLTDAVRFNTSAGVSVGVGELAWNNSDGTLDLGMKGGNVVQQIGQEIFYEVRNETGIQIPNGTAVFASGVTAGSARITASPYTADGSVREVRFLGIATEDISNGVNGFVTYFGYVRGLDTRGTTASSIAVGDETWAVGDILYVHPTVAGKLTNVKPEHAITVAIIITRHQSVGVLFVRPSSGGHLEDIHDILINTGSLTNGQVLAYNSTSGLWENTNSLSGSYQITGSFSGSFTGNGSGLIGVVSSSYSVTSSYSLGVDFDNIQNLPSGIISSSAQLANTSIPGNLTVGGTLTAEEFYTEYVTSSVIYRSGSTKFGDTSDDTHQFTGSIRVLGSVSGSFSGSFRGNGSLLTNLNIPAGVYIYTGSNNTAIRPLSGSNSATACFATIGGGRNNIASGCYSVVSGGGDAFGFGGNTASARYTTVGGGTGNTASGIESTIGGGNTNTASGILSSIGGGFTNNTSGCESTIGGGTSNTASGYRSSILGGSEHLASANYTTVGGGASNTASACCSTVAGGSSNTASGLNSGILGGTTNNICTFADSFIVGSNICATAACYTFMNNTCTLGTTRTQALVETSAKKHKKDINPLGSQLQNVAALNPVEFTWKESNKKDIGLIAEEMDKIYPELVSREENGDIHGINYSKITAVLVKAVQEQQNQIEELKLEVQKLKAL